MLRRVFVIAAIIAAVLVVCAGGLVGTGLYLTRDLKPVETKKISDSVFVVKGGMGNLYLAGRNGVYVAFDAANDPKKVAAGCVSLSIDPLTVQAVFLTHTDADHVDGLPAFPRATVYISRDEEPLITGVTPRHSLGIKHFNKLPVESYRTLGDGDSVIIGGMTVHAIATPGHTPGSMCFRVDDYLFTGDLCIIKAGVVEPMLKIFTEDMAGDSASIRKVAGMIDVRTICTAHTGFSTDFPAATAKWR